MFAPKTSLIAHCPLPHCFAVDVARCPRVATVYIARTAAICWRMMMKFVRLTQLIDVIYEATRSTLLQSMSMKLLYVSVAG